MRRRWWIAGCILMLARPAAAQVSSSSPVRDPEAWRSPRWAGHVTVLAGNAVLAGLTGGVQQALKGRSFADGFARGALGGAVGYAGKRLVVQRFPLAGLLGREVHAVGVSMIRNAGEGASTFSRLFLPLGPLPLRAILSLRGGVRFQPRLDLVQAAWLAGGLVEPGVRLDVAESFSSGAAVFRAEGRRLDEAAPGVLGVTASRVVFVGDPRLYPGPATTAADVLAHERVHVLQEDFVLTAWSDPAASAALDRFGAGRWVSRYAVADVLGWVPGWVSGLSFGKDGQDHSPAELEALFLTGH